MGIKDNIIKILIKAEDQASETIKKTQKTFENAELSHQKEIEKTNQKLQETVQNFNKVAKEGSTSFNNLSKSQQQAIIKFSMLDKEAQKAVQTISRVGLNGASTWAQLTVQQQNALMNLAELNSSTNIFSRALEQAKTKMSLMGQETDGVKGKITLMKETISQLGVEIGSNLSDKWTTFKNNVNTAASNIKNALGNALSLVRSKLDSLGQAFSGLGGIISGAIGAIGMNSIKDLTVGLAMTREQMVSLTTATLGSRDAALAFAGSEGVLDKMTDNSLVSLNDLGQAMNTIKMSTGMTNEELTNFASVVNDIGQRAILMGKDSTEAMSLMQAAGRGLNGEFDMLKTNFGITKQQLVDLGWSGAADDVAGYQAALEQALEAGGSMDGMLNTTTGLLKQVEKRFTTAGRKIGEMFMPAIREVLKFMLDLEKTCPGVYGALIMVAGAISGFATLGPTLSPILTSFDAIVKYSKSALVFFGLLNAEEGALTLKQSMLTAAQWLGADAAVVEAAATGGLTAAFWALAGAIWAALAPLLPFIIAAAAIAIAVFEIGKAFGWWSDIGTMIDAVWAGLQRLWQAFINNPNVQGFLQDLTNLWNGLCEALQPVIQWAQKVWVEMFPESASGGFDIVRTIIDMFGAVGDVLGKVVNAAKWFWSEFGGYIMMALNIITAPVQMIVAILRTIICILLGCSPGIVPALQSVYEWFSTVWNGIASFIGPIISGIVGVIGGIVDVLGQVWEALQPVVEYLVGVLTPVFELVSSIVFTIVDTVWQLINVFQQFLNGQISLGDLLSAVWSIISQMFASILGQIINSVVSWASNLWNQALTAGQNFVNGVVQWISQLPGRVGQWIMSTASRILSGAAQWVANAKQKALDTVNGVIDWIKQLPGKVKDEFMKVPDRIREALGAAINAAVEFGKGILDGVLGALGIHSPGIVQNKIAKEFDDTVNRISESVSDASTVATEFGDAIRDGVGDVSIDANLNNPLVGEDNAQTVSMGADTSALSNSLGDVNDLTLAGNEAILSSFDLLNEGMNTSLNQMVTDNMLAYSTMQSNDASTMQMIQQNMSNSLNSMRLNSNTQLNSMFNTTKNTNSKVTTSWSQMGSSVIKTSENIKTKATGYFNQLSSTIGGFYRKLQNPSSWGAGSYGGGTGKPSRMRKVGHTDNMSSKIKSIFQRQNIDTEKISIRQAELNPFIDTSSLAYINPSGISNNVVSLRTLAEYGALKLPKGDFGGWDATNVNYKHIHDTANKWKMKTPNIGRYTTNGQFVVEQFETGVPKIDYNTFRSLAEDVYSQTSYDFYANSEKYGNWATAFMSGSFNCSDGADSLVAMAHAFGLSAHKVHGHWNNLGHFWAEVEGHKMDTTGWQQRRTWTPSASHAGPAPKNSFWNNPLANLESVFSDDTNDTKTNSSDDPIKVDAKIAHTHNINLENVPKGVNEADLMSMIEQTLNNTTNDEKWIDKLVNNQAFQELDIRIKERIKNRENRNMGVIH